MIDYGEVLSKAWKIVWKNKILWIFGILASFGQGSGGGSGGGGSNTTGYSRGSDFDFSLPNFDTFDFFEELHIHQSSTRNRSLLYVDQDVRTSVENSCLAAFSGLEIDEIL